MPRKRSAGENGNMSGATPACRIKINAAGDWQIAPPAGQITQIGNAAATSQGLVNNDDLHVCGKFEVDGRSYFDFICTFNAVVYFNVEAFVGRDFQMAAAAEILDYGPGGSGIVHRKTTEEITIPVGQGLAGINTVANLAIADSIIVAVLVRVQQAPGGGATNFDVGRTGGNADEFIQNLAVALGTQGSSAADGDGVNAGPVHNAAANTFVVTTDANVTVSDMIIRIVVYSKECLLPTL